MICLDWKSCTQPTVLLLIGFCPCSCFAVCFWPFLVSACGFAIVAIAVLITTPPHQQVLKWDKEETAKGGPFPEILTDCDVFVNCILLQVRFIGLGVKPFRVEG